MHSQIKPCFSLSHQSLFLFNSRSYSAPAIRGAQSTGAIFAWLIRRIPPPHHHRMYSCAFQIQFSISPSCCEGSLDQRLQDSTLYYLIGLHSEFNIHGWSFTSRSQSANASSNSVRVTSFLPCRQVIFTYCFNVILPLLFCFFVFIRHFDCLTYVAGPILPHKDISIWSNIFPVDNSNTIITIISVLWPEKVKVR